MLLLNRIKGLSTGKSRSADVVRVSWKCELTVEWAKCELAPVYCYLKS